MPALSLAAGVYTAKDAAGNDVSVCYEGLVPCGLGKPLWKTSDIVDGRCDRAAAHVMTNSTEGIACQFCHFFVMIGGIIDFVLIRIVPYLAVFIIVVGGIMFYFGGGKPDLLNRGKKLITGALIGLLLIYGAYMIVGTFLSVLGVTEWTGLASWARQGAFSINCQVTIP